MLIFSLQFCSLKCQAYYAILAAKTQDSADLY